tara:strand:- start:3569 stop:4711 length:1143 start_codon:yes stop_codon:yes gene_type:complete
MASNTSDFYTYSKSAGTAKNLQKPQDGGDNNQWGNFINVDLDSIVAAVNATSDLIADANQNELVDFTATGSAVNHIGISNKATGSGPVIEAVGDDTNIDLNLNGKGTGALASTGAKLTSPKVITGVNDTNGNELVKFTATGSAVNHVGISNKATGSGPVIEAVGDDTNIDLNITPKGTGNAVVSTKVEVDDIVEKTADHGVEIDGVTLKDSIITSGTFNGTIGSSATLAEGMMIQQKTTIYTTEVNYAAGTSAISQVAVTISPKAGSDILLFVSMTAATSSGSRYGFYVSKSGTTALSGNVAGSASNRGLVSAGASGIAGNSLQNVNFVNFDENVSAGSTTYTVCIINEANTKINRSQDDSDSSSVLRGISSITAIEIES